MSAVEDTRINGWRSYGRRLSEGAATLEAVAPKLCLRTNSVLGIDRYWHGVRCYKDQGHTGDCDGLALDPHGRYQLCFIPSDDKTTACDRVARHPGLHTFQMERPF